jgi:hypothetical protein
MIGVANRTAGAREKDRAAAKALAIDPDSGGDRASGLRALDHDHSHSNLPRFCFCLLNGTGRLDCAFLGAGYLGGITHLLFYRALGGRRIARGEASPTGRFTLRAAF